MTDVQEFCLRWNNHQSNLISAFYDLKLGEDFVDVTLACEGQYLQAHKVVLSACSPFFRDILKATPCKHPVIVLKDILYNDLVSLIEFIYMGEVRVKNQGLSSFLSTAEVLRVRGLTEPSSKYKTSLLACPENNSAVPRIPNLDGELCPPFSAHLDDALQESLQNSPVPSGTGRSRDTPGSSHPPDFSAEIKVEDIDLDSADEEDDEEEDGGAKAREMDDRVSEPPRETGLDSGEDGQGYSGPSHVPSLTLQSFARIPALTPLAAPLQLNDDNVPTSHDIIPGAAIESDGVAGRTSGRISSSDRPRWPCPFCLRLLSSRSSVRRHIEDRHTNDTSRHPCPLCERLYRTRNSLQYHLSTAHRDREPGPRGRPRTRPRTPSSTMMTASAAESALPLDNGGGKNSLSSSHDPPETGCPRNNNNNNNPSSTLMTREMSVPPPYAFPPT